MSVEISHEELISPQAYEAADRAYEGKEISEAERKEIGRCIDAIHKACDSEQQVSLGILLWALYSAKYSR